MTRQPKTPGGFLSLATRATAERVGGAPGQTAEGLTGADALSVLDCGGMTTRSRPATTSVSQEPHMSAIDGFTTAPKTDRPLRVGGL
jgi:hypothetical protein